MEWPVGNGGKGNDGVASTVQGTKGSIGYVELAYANNPQHKMSYASIQNAAGQFIEPSADGAASAVADAAGAMSKDIRSPIVNGKGAKTYPISGMTYLLVYKAQRDADKGKALTGFVKWALTDGQKHGQSIGLRAAAARSGQIGSRRHRRRKISYVVLSRHDGSCRDETQKFRIMAKV